MSFLLTLALSYPIAVAPRTVNHTPTPVVVAYKYDETSYIYELMDGSKYIAINAHIAGTNLSYTSRHPFTGEAKVMPTEWIADMLKSASEANQ